MKGDANNLMIVILDQSVKQRESHGYIEALQRGASAKSTHYVKCFKVSMETITF